MKINHIPEGCHSIVPYIHAVDAARLIEFLKRAFGGVERTRIMAADGRVMHAQGRLGDSIVMLGEPHDQWQARPIMLYHYVPDVDSTYKQALAAGAESLFAPMNMFYGDRLACVKDFAGNNWSLATHIEDVSPEQLQKMLTGSQPPSKNPSA